MNKLKKKYIMKYIRFMTGASLVIIGIILALMISTSLMVSCNQIKKDVAVRKVSAVVHPEWSENAVIYEVNVRQYTPEGTLKAFEEHLPRLKDMGIDILWLMPIHPIGVEKRKGGLGSYYSVQDYKGINPEFGTMQDFKDLVNKAHELGMYLILDWVPNHSAWDNQLVFDHPEWYQKNSNGSMISPFDWTDVVALDYDNPELREYMTDALKFWVIEADIDGYRCDVANEVPLDYWNEATDEVRKVKDVFFLAEAEVPEHHDKAFDMSYGWELHHIMNQLANGEANANNLRTYFKKNDSIFPQNSFRMHFTSNHDENSWNGTEFERMGNAYDALAVFTFTSQGMPLIYSGQEAGLDKRLRFFEKDTIIWDDLTYQEFYKRLIDLKKSNKALEHGSGGGEFIILNNTQDKSIFSFLREKDGNKVLSILNFSDKPVEFKFDDEKANGSYNDYFEGSQVEIMTGDIIILEPWKYKVLIDN